MDGWGDRWGTDGWTGRGDRWGTGGGTGGWTGGGTGGGVGGGHSSAFPGRRLRCEVHIQYLLYVYILYMYQCTSHLPTTVTMATSLRTW